MERGRRVEGGGREGGRGGGWRVEDGGREGGRGGGGWRWSVEGGGGGGGGTYLSISALLEMFVMAAM